MASCDQAGRARISALGAATKRRCFVLTHGERGADCVPQAMHDWLGCATYAREVLAETESIRGQAVMVRVADSEPGRRAVPRMLGLGRLNVAGRRYTMLRDA
eukprot:15456199-Alexandrium_andersonii.AAC.1